MTPADWRKWLCLHIEQFSRAYETNTNWMHDGLTMTWSWPWKCARQECGLELTEYCVAVPACGHRFCGETCGNEFDGCAHCTAAFAKQSEHGRLQLWTDPATHRPKLSQFLWDPSKGIAREGVPLWDALLHCVATKFAELKVPGRVLPDDTPVHVRLWRCIPDQHTIVDMVFMHYPPVDLQNWVWDNDGDNDTPNTSTIRHTLRDLATRIQPTVRPACHGREPFLWDCVLHDEDYMVPADVHPRDANRLLQLFPPHGQVDDASPDTEHDQMAALLADSIECGRDMEKKTAGNSKLTRLQQHRLLDQTLHQHGHSGVQAMRDIEDDGNCLYAAVLAMMHKETDQHAIDSVLGAPVCPDNVDDLRSAVADELLEHEYCPGQEDEERQKHADKHRMTSEWADEFCVAALATILRRTIRVVSSAPEQCPDPLEYLPVNWPEKRAKPPVMLLGHIYGLHYTGTQSLDDLDEHQHISSRCVLSRHCAIHMPYMPCTSRILCVQLLPYMLCTTCILSTQHLPYMLDGILCMQLLPYMLCTTCILGTQHLPSVYALRHIVYATSPVYAVHHLHVVYTTPAVYGLLPYTYV